MSTPSTSKKSRTLVAATVVPRVGTQTFEFIAARNLEILPQIQRSVVPAQVIYLASGWDENKVGVVTVWRVTDEDGTVHNYLIDGQERWSAKNDAQLTGQAGVVTEPDYKFYCDVREGLTEQEAAAIFLGYNRGRRNVDSYGRWWVGVTANEPIPLGVKLAVEKAGFEVGPDSTKTTVGCVAAMTRVVEYRTKSGRRTIGENVKSLTWALKLFEAAYVDTTTPNPPAIWRGEFVESLALLHARYAATGKLDTARLLRALKTYKHPERKIFGGEALLSRAREQQIGNNRANLVAEFVRIHDKGLHAKNRLEPGRDELDDDE